MADRYIVTRTSLENVASAIRSKAGISTLLTYPSGFVSAINSISTGSGTTIQNQNKTVTPTTSIQSVTADSGYTGLGTVTVNAIPSNYIIPSGNKAITANGTNIDVKAYATVSVSVSGGSSISLQSKTGIVPTESSQTIQPDSGYGGLSSVQINAITATYVGSGVTQRTSSNLTVSGATVTAPAGYYASSASKCVTTMTLPTSVSSNATSGYSSKLTVNRSTSTQYINIPPGYNSAGGYYTISAVANGSATGPTSLSGTGATISTGTNTITLTKTGVATTPTVSAGYVSNATASTATITLTGSVTTKAAATYTPTTSDQTINSGTYLTGIQTIKGDSNLIAANIANGISIFGITGTYQGAGGSGIGTLLTTYTVGSISTTSTSATNTNKSITVNSINDYDLLIVETSVDSITNNRHVVTTKVIVLTAGTNNSTKDSATIATATWNAKISSSGVVTTRQSTTAYGIYPYSCSISNGNATITLYQRYNSTQTGTINGTYITRIYGIKLYELVGG